MLSFTKANAATLLSTLGLTLALALPSASHAASVDSICFDTGTMVYKLFMKV